MIWQAVETHLARRRPDSGESRITGFAMHALAGDFYRAACIGPIHPADAP
jgi:hypothetical protein